MVLCRTFTGSTILQCCPLSKLQSMTWYTSQWCTRISRVYTPLKEKLSDKIIYSVIIPKIKTQKQWTKLSKIYTTCIKPLEVCLIVSSILPVENLYLDAVIQTSLTKPDYLKEGKPSTKIYCFHNILNQKWRKMQLLATLVWTPILWLPRCRTYNKIEERKTFTCYIWQRNGIHLLF